MTPGYAWIAVTMRTAHVAGEKPFPPLPTRLFIDHIVCISEWSDPSLPEVRSCVETTRRSLLLEETPDEICAHIAALFDD